MDVSDKKVASGRGKEDGTLSDGKGTCGEVVGSKERATGSPPKPPHPQNPKKTNKEGRC